MTRQQKIQEALAEPLAQCIARIDDKDGREAYNELIATISLLIDEEVVAALEIHDLEQGIELLDVQCSPGCKNCDSKRPLHDKLQQQLAALKKGDTND